MEEKIQFDPTPGVSRGLEQPPRFGWVARSIFHYRLLSDLIPPPDIYFGSYTTIDD